MLPDYAQHFAAVEINNTFYKMPTWGYVRLRREKYIKKDLAKWLVKIQSQPWKACYVFFKHEDTGTGPRYAAQLLDLASTNR